MRAEAVTAAGTEALDTDELREHHPCFGRFSATARECKACTAPVFVQGGCMMLYRDLCAAVRGGSDNLAPITRLTTDDVRSRLENGASVFDIWREMLGSADPHVRGREARQLLYHRLRYLRDSAHGSALRIPDRLPSIASLLSRTASQ